MTYEWETWKNSKITLVFNHQKNLEKFGILQALDFCFFLNLPSIYIVEKIKIILKQTYKFSGFDFIRFENHIEKNEKQIWNFAEKSGNLWVQRSWKS